MAEDSNEFHWDNIFFVKVYGYFIRSPINYSYLAIDTSRSKTNSFMSLNANSYNGLKSLRTCSFYLLGLRRPVKVRIKIIPLYLKDIRKMNLLAC